MKPVQFFKPGDVVTLGIEKLGEQRQNAKEEDWRERRRTLAAHSRAEFAAGACRKKAPRERG
jgi:hypothetical protein